MARLYNYTIYRQDGSVEQFGPRKRMELAELQSSVGGRIEVLPKYFTLKGGKKLGGHFTGFINEEGKFNGSVQNPHFDPYHLDPEQTFNGLPWDDFITGDVLIERYAGKDAVAA